MALVNSVNVDCFETSIGTVAAYSAKYSALVAYKILELLFQY